MANGSCTVTPGITWTSTTPGTAANFNLLAKPGVAVDDQSIGSDQLIKSEVLELLGGGAAGDNYFSNPNFAEVRWSRGSTPVSCPVGQRTFRADDWWCRPSGAAVSYARLETGPNYQSKHCAELTGAAGATRVDFGQDIPAHVAAALGAPLVLTFQLYNSTGAAFAPTVEAYTADTSGNFTAVTNRFSDTPATSVANATWQLFTVAFDATGMTNIANGLQIVISIPSGSLNSVGKSVRFAQMKIELGTEASTFVVPQFEPTEAAQAGEAGGGGGAATLNATLNFFTNGGFYESRWQYPAGVTVPGSVGVDNWNAEGWWARVTGSTGLVYGRDTSVPNPDDLFSARLTGAAGVNDVHFGQNILRDTAVLMKNRQMTFSIGIGNFTGAAITPTLFLVTPTSLANDFNAGTLQASAALQVCADNGFTQVTYQFDGSTIAGLEKGLRLYLLFPSGALDSGAKYLLLAEAQLEEGLAVTNFVAERQENRPLAITGEASNLIIASTSIQDISVSFGECALLAPDGRRELVRPVTALTAHMPTSGLGGLDTGAEAADTWYYIWVVSNGITPGILISTSSTSPVMPASYTRKALIGVVRNNAGSHFEPFRQDGKIWYGLIKSVATINASVALTWQNLSVASHVPPIAAEYFGTIGTASAHHLQVDVCGADAAAGDKIGAQFLMCGPSGVAYLTRYTAIPFRVPMIVPQQYSWRANQVTPTVQHDCTGFRLR